MKKKLYIHIGRPKVGSSAIQHFLFMNRDYLLNKNKMLYPKTGVLQKASHRLALVFLPGFMDASSVKKNIDCNDIYDELVDEIENSGAASAVISSENFYFVEPHKLALSLQNRFDVKIICYVRRQDEVLVSSFVQEIKGNAIPFDTTFEEYTSNTLRMELLDYYPILTKWGKTFGNENIIVRVYENGQMQKNIFSDFLDSIGILINNKFRLPEKRLNPSPSLDILEYIHLINKFDADETVYRNLRRPLLDISESMELPAALSSKNVFTLDQRISIIDKYKDSNSKVAREFLNRSEGILFFKSPVDDQLAPVKYQGISFDRLTKITAGLFLYQADMDFQLKKRIIKSEKRIIHLEEEIRALKSENRDSEKRLTQNRINKSKNIKESIRLRIKTYTKKVIKKLGIGYL